ncbi:MAG: phosphatase PAP2 family protein [Uliginosibacterium sp.]|nr:phosphatase PAP2 family protein [Uliginosibacterium sp.]
MSLSTIDDTKTWFGMVWQRVLAHFKLKAFGTTLFMCVFFTAYINLLKNPLFPVWQMPLTFVDHVVGFYPPALLVYCSLWVFVSLPPMLFTDRRELVRYGRDVGLVCIAGLLCFLCLPTAVPPANIDWAMYPGMGFLKGVDAAGNACPSLHVATAVFSACWLGAQLKVLGASKGLRWANWLWCAAIVYSTLATKQHVALDVLGGWALGAGGAWLSLARSPWRQSRLQTV